MIEQKQGKHKAVTRTGKFLWLVTLISFLVIFATLVYRHLNHRSINERLAAIEANWAIPDSENAAILYDRILQNPNASINYRSELHDHVFSLTRSQPWTGNDYPEYAEWIKKHQWLINELAKVQQLKKCRFPLNAEPFPSIQAKRTSTMRKWAFLLSQAANNDVGEGRIDDAISKWQCMIQMGQHIQQQSRIIEYFGGNVIESLGVRRAIDFLAEGNASEHHLRKIESFQLQTQDDWTAAMDRILPVEEHSEKKYKRQLSWMDRLKYEFKSGPFPGRQDTYHRVCEKYHNRKLIINRGMYIMVALRRYKNENGHWPKTLDRIEPCVTEEILTDPHTKGSFVYKLTNNGFILYSKGKNNLDEGLRMKEGADDWPVWPSRRRISQAKHRNPK